MSAALSICERSVLISYSNIWSWSSLNFDALFIRNRKGIDKYFNNLAKKKKRFCGISCKIICSRTRGIVTLLAGDGDPLVPRACGVRAQVCGHVCRTANRQWIRWDGASHSWRCAAALTLVLAPRSNGNCGSMLNLSTIHAHSGVRGRHEVSVPQL